MGQRDFFGDGLGCCSRVGRAGDRATDNEDVGAGPHGLGWGHDPALIAQQMQAQVLKIGAPNLGTPEEAS